MLRAIQLAGQRAFLTAESALGLAFGNRHNPLHHLGAITYFLLWIAMVTGLYLYAFFETSAVKAYASVEALTHGQRFAGGVMRSLHRYASDAVVVCMVLHLLRHFTFDRHRGFRWFSWITGVMLLWMTFASGINGYMLPWDRVAQYVVTATTEWLELIPVFGAGMTRNFVSNANVSDRLFSLLSFVHIGLPLTVLAVLWIHTQRVAGARTNPPRELAIGILAMLLVLSLWAPALSQPPADMGSVPTAIAFDWFYLPPFATMDRWGPLASGLALVAVTGMLLALPWMPPARRKEKRSFDMAVYPDDRIIGVRNGETLLDAGLRAGLPMAFECRNGACGACQCTLRHGQVEHLAHLPAALPDADRAAGKVLLCCAVPLSDVEIVHAPVAGAKPLAVKQYIARITRMELLAPDVMRVMFCIEGGMRLGFRAGQYINILLEDNGKRSFSFATAPERVPPSGEIELHIRKVEGGRFTTRIFTSMKAGDSFRFEGPLGAFTLREDGDKPVIFVAGSTGFAPVKSMLEHAFDRGIRRQMILYWGVRQRTDLYMADLAEEWARSRSNFSFVPVLSDPQPEEDWHGRTGLVHEAILADFPDLSSHQVYACGSVAMVDAVYPAFAKHGISSEDCFSDAFHLAPQRPLQADAADLIKLGGHRG